LVELVLYASKFLDNFINILILSHRNQQLSGFQTKVLIMLFTTKKAALASNDYTYAKLVLDLVRADEYLKSSYYEDTTTKISIDKDSSFWTIGIQIDYGFEMVAYVKISLNDSPSEITAFLTRQLRKAQAIKSRNATTSFFTLD
jgi:hypothetical protein